MTDEHARYETLAVGHVLGGLAEDEAATFRRHLVSCGSCKMRVAELRDIAEDLAAAEREERALASTATKVARRDDDEDEAAEEARRGWQAPEPRLLLLGAAALLLVALIAIGFWNLHLRSNNQALIEATTAREAVLSSLGSGDVLEADLATGIEGVVVLDGKHVAFSLSGLPTLQPGQTLMVWLLEDDRGPGQQQPLGNQHLSDGRFAHRYEHHGAKTLVLSVESGTQSERPAGRVLVEVDLTQS